MKLEIETWGLNHDAVIVQIGACYFDRYSGKIGNRYKVNIDPQSSLDMGFKVSASTIEWWLGQSEEARKSITAEPRYHVTDAIRGLNEFLSKAKAIWSHATFDMPKIMHHIEVFDLFPKFHYSAAKDIRTLTGLAGISKRQAPEREGIHHDALDDCLYQVQYCVMCFNKLKEK